MPNQPDPYGLERYLSAQEQTHSHAELELAAGRKRSHWMWFTFPQCEGLGQSHMDQRFCIKSLAEARAYLAHPVLGTRLGQLTALVLQHPHTPVEDIFGSVDALKFRSSMTLFAAISKPHSVFHQALEVFYHAKMDPLTERWLEKQHAKGF